MRKDSVLAGGQAWGTQRQHLAGRPWLLGLAEILPAADIPLPRYSGWDVQPQPPFKVVCRSWGGGGGLCGDTGSEMLVKKKRTKN